jgi:DNA-directed RNA polymerase specialized sigma24 family protein
VSRWLGGAVLDEMDDESIVKELRRTGCRGRVWELFSAEQFLRAQAEIRSMIVVNSIGRRTAKAGWRVVLFDAERSELLTDPHALIDIVTDAFGAYLTFFRTKLMREQGWQRDRGLPLRDWFFRGVLRHLGNPMRRWVRARNKRLAHECSTDDVLEVLSSLGHEVDLDDILDARDLLADVFCAMREYDPRLFRVIQRTAIQGESLSAAARSAGMSPKAIGERLRRFRSWYRRTGGTGGS